jgi:hypothetical protein
VIRTRLPLVCALLAPALLAGQEKLTIKIRHSTQGDITQHSREQTRKEAVTVTGPDGNVLQEKAQTIKEINKYKEEVIEKKAGERPAKLKRTYTEATRKTDDELVKQSYHEKTVEIEKKTDGYRFTIDGKELTAAEAGDLAETFNTKKSKDEELDKLLLPTRPVAVGDQWNIDAAKFLKLLGDDDKLAKSIDGEKAKATGKLTKAYKKDGRQCGIVEFAFSVPMKALEGVHPCRDGAKFEMTIVVDGCIDGTAQPESATMTMKVTGTADLVQDGQKTGATIKFDVSAEEKGTTKPASK